MRSCEWYKVRLMLYRDGELDGREMREVENHLQSCSACRIANNKEIWFVKSVQRTSPLYEVPPALRSRVVPLVDKVSPCVDDRDSDQEEHQKHDVASHDVGRHRVGWVRATAAVLVSLTIVAGLWGLWTMLEREELPSFAEMAVDTHRRHELGQLPLEIRAQDSTKISDWFQDKLPFTLKLPNYQDTSGQDKRYYLEGARLVGFNGDYAAFVSYRMEDHPISLLATSQSAAAPTGKDIISSRGIDFHYDTISDLKVITWSHRDLTYALVSDLEERGQQSCLVCHQGAKDKDFLETQTRLLYKAQVINITQN